MRRVSSHPHFVSTSPPHPIDQHHHLSSTLSRCDTALMRNALPYLPPSAEAARSSRTACSTQSRHPCDLTRPLTRADSASPLDLISAGVGLPTSEGQSQACSGATGGGRGQEPRLLESLGGRALHCRLQLSHCKGDGECSLPVCRLIAA